MLLHFTYNTPIANATEIPNFFLVDMCKPQMIFWGSRSMMISETRLIAVADVIKALLLMHLPLILISQIARYGVQARLTEMIAAT